MARILQKTLLQDFNRCLRKDDGITPAIQMMTKPQVLQYSGEKWLVAGDGKVMLAINERSKTIEGLEDMEEGPVSFNSKTGVFGDSPVFSSFTNEDKAGLMKMVHSILDDYLLVRKNEYLVGWFENHNAPLLPRSAENFVVTWIALPNRTLRYIGINVAIPVLEQHLHQGSLGYASLDLRYCHIAWGCRDMYAREMKFSKKSLAVPMAFRLNQFDDDKGLITKLIMAFYRPIGD